MTDDNGGMPAAGWYPDRPNPTALRWWDGAGWTDHWHPLESAVAAQPEPVQAAEPRAPEPAPEPAPALAPALQVAPAVRQLAVPTAAAVSGPVPTLVIAPGQVEIDLSDEEPAQSLSSVDLARVAGGYAPLGRDAAPDRSWMFQKAKRSSQTISGWALALSPLWMGIVTLAALVYLPQYPTLLVQGVAGLLGFVLWVLLVIIDTERLRAKGHRAPSAWWLLLPVLYFIMRVVRVGRGSIAMLVTFLLSGVAFAGLVAFLLLQTTLLASLLPTVDDTAGTVTVGAPELTAEQRAALLTDAGTEAELRQQLEQTWSIGTLDCEPFPADTANTTTTCVVELDGVLYNAGLEVTPDAPSSAFVLTGMLPAE